MVASSVKRRAQSTQTRERLIEAAIELIARQGFAATTMRHVADRAGVTQGPRQYYFPTTNDIYDAVVEHIHETTTASLEGLLTLTDLPIEERLRRFLSGAFAGCGSDHHLAMLELKLACRGNEALRETIGAKIAAAEARYDEIWLNMFADSASTKDELIELRRLLACSLRGYAIALVSEETDVSRQTMANRLTTLFTQTITKQKT